MRHIEAELLAGLALGEPDPLTDHQRRHLATCRECQAELTALRGIARTGREADPVAILVPGPDVLPRITAELAVELVPTAVAPTSTTISGIPRTRAPRRRGLILLAATAGLILGIGGTLAFDRVTRSDEQVLATTTLVALPGQSGSGRAEVVRADGVERLRVEVDTAAPGNEFRELWLINTDGQRMISLGVLPASGRGSYALPGLRSGALRDYAVVDVSLEPYDGDAAHSQDSVVRGTLA